MARPPKKEKGLYTRTDASGALWWYYRVYLNGREHRGGPYKTKGEAKAAREQLTSDHRRGKVDPEGGWQRIDDVLDRHVASKADKKDQRTQRRLLRWWKARCRAAGLVRIKDLTVRFLEDVRDELKRERIKLGPMPRLASRRKRTPPVGKPVEAVGKVRAGGTVNRYVIWLHAALGSVKQTQRRLFDHWEWEAESRGVTRYLMVEEEAALFAALGPIYGSWMRLSILTGLRQTEQFRLEWRHVDLERHLVTLPQTKSGGVQFIHLSKEIACGSRRSSRRASSGPAGMTCVIPAHRGWPKAGPMPRPLRASCGIPGSGWSSGMPTCPNSIGRKPPNWCRTLGGRGIRRVIRAKPETNRKRRVRRERGTVRWNRRKSLTLRGNGWNGRPAVYELYQIQHQTM